MHNTSETVNNFNSDIAREIVKGRRPLVTPVALQFNDSINQDQVYLRSGGWCKPFIFLEAIIYFYSITAHTNLHSDIKLNIYKNNNWFRY